MSSELILPSEIPWDNIKGKDLEELLYWLFDSMGAKDLEWRIGGSGNGAPDQGRDLELAFFSPSPDGTLSKQVWWVEAKGRKNTVEPSEVHEAVFNAAGKRNIEVLVIATNTNFSNPTRDWVKRWQNNNARPIIKLWERTELENLCSKNPVAVIRLHSKALSPQGRLEVASTKLWEYASFSDEPTLKLLWKEQINIEIDKRSLFALVASEIANGDIGERSWVFLVEDETLIACLCNGLINFLYLTFRANEVGAKQIPIIKAISYLVLVSTKRVGPESVSSIITSVWEDVEGREYPEQVRSIILEPILGNLQAELKDVCISDCNRIITDKEVLSEIEVENYWERMALVDATKTKDNRILTIESHKEPCVVGFCVDENAGCPLCNIDKPQSNILEFIQVVEKVVEFRCTESENV